MKKIQIEFFSKVIVGLVGKTGQTVMPYSHIIESERKGLNIFRQALSKNREENLGKIII
jgi:hypothetical protein